MLVNALPKEVQLCAAMCHFISVELPPHLHPRRSGAAQGVASPPGPPGASRAMSRQWAAHMSALEHPTFPPSARLLGCHLDNFTAKYKTKAVFLCQK